MATNTFNNMKDAPGVITKMAAQMLADELQFCKSIAKAPASDFDGKNGYKAGDTIQISKPPRYTTQTGFDLTSSIQNTVEEKTSLSLDVISSMGIETDSLEFATEVELTSLMERFIKPAVSRIAQDVESRFLQKAVDATYNSVGTAGSTSFTTAQVLAARTRLNKYLAPKDNNRFILLDSESGADAVDQRKGLFQSSAKIAEQYENGMIGRSDGFNWLENELLPVHTNGNDVSGVNVNGASQTGATLNLQGFTTSTGTVTKGSVFTIAGVYAVHPITKATLTHLQQFVVTADGTADGSGNIAVGISPSIVTTGSTQTVSVSPADTAALTFVGSASTDYLQNLAFHKEAFRMVSVPLILPSKAEFASQSTSDGVTVAIVRDWDQKTRKMITRLDFLGGIAAVRPEWATRLTA